VETLQRHEENELRDGNLLLCIAQQGEGRDSSSPSLTHRPWGMQSPAHRHEGLEDAVEDEVPHHLTSGDVWHKPDEEVGDDSKRGGEDDPLGGHSVSLTSTQHLGNPTSPALPAATRPVGFRHLILGAPELPQGGPPRSNTWTEGGCHSGDLSRVEGSSSGLTGWEGEGLTQTSREELYL